MERALFLLAAGLSLVPMAGTALTLFRTPAALASLCPLLLLAFFKTRARSGAAWLLAGSALVCAGMLFDRLSLFWIGSYWNFLALCAYSGRGFSFPAPLLIFSAPPLSAFTSVAFGFWLRLRLSDMAAALLGLIDPHTSVSGNVISFAGDSFAVDRLCEGTKMAAATALLSFVLFRESAKPARWFIAIAAFPLWLFSNILRIVILVLFKVPPASSAHEILGAALFVSMVVFPIAVARALFPAPSAAIAAPVLRPAVSRLYALIALFALLSAGWAFASPEPRVRQWPERISGFLLDQDSVESDPRIAVYNHADGSSLILKTDLFAPGTAHDPRICFEAAGFSFLSETEETIGGIRLRSARVIKAGKPARLYWWYAWDGERSSSDLLWRGARTRGRHVFQWNLYGKDPESLRRAALILLKTENPRSPDG